MLAEDHRARLIWRVVQTLDLCAFTANAKALPGKAGRDVLSPPMLLTLWLYAISIGVGSAREIARRTTSDDAFRWIVGDQEVGHASLSAFRVGHWAALEKLMTDVLGVLLQKQEPRASTTDADARVMKMPDGGFRPGYNIQLATAGSELGGARTIVGLVRGLTTVTCVALLGAVAANILTHATAWLA